MRWIGQELAQRRLEEIRHALEIDLARRQQPADRIGQAMTLRHGERRSLVGKPGRPAPAGQGPFDAEKRGPGGTDFGGHGSTIARLPVEHFARRIVAVDYAQDYPHWAPASVRRKNAHRCHSRSMTSSRMKA